MLVLAVHQVNEVTAKVAFSTILLQVSPNYRLLTSIELCFTQLNPLLLRLPLL